MSGFPNFSFVLELFVLVHFIVGFSDELFKIEVEIYRCVGTSNAGGDLKLSFPDIVSHHEDIVHAAAEYVWRKLHWGVGDEGAGKFVSAIARADTVSANDVMDGASYAAEGEVTLGVTVEVVDVLKAVHIY